MRKLAVAFLLIAVLLGGIAVGATIRYIISDTVTVTMEEAVLTLNVNATSCLVNDVLNFSGTFTVNGYVYVGETVTLYRDGVDTGYFTLTDADGYYEILYQVTEKGTFDFYTNATITT